MYGIRTAALLALVIVLSGCATKNYGRQGDVTDFEKNTMTCRELELETAKVHGFLSRVEQESQFDGRSVLSFLGDFGVGNVLEKSSATESANKRLAQLQDARAVRRCGTVADAPTANGAAPVAQAPAAKPVAAPTGQESYQVQRMARDLSCHTDPSPVLTGKGPGFEAYSVSCSNGDALMVRCEFGNCRTLR